jgi:hypothetical protein
VEVPISLQRGEVYYLCCEARWLEYRKRTQTVGYYSSGVSFRVALGVYYRVGASRPQRVTTDGLTEVSSGTVYFTNKRLLFEGVQRNSAIRWSSVFAFEAFADGISIEKATGRRPHLMLAGDAELAAVIRGAILAGEGGLIAG